MQPDSRVRRPEILMSVNAQGARLSPSEQFLAAIRPTHAVCLHHRAVTLDTGSEHFVTRSLPPIPGGKNLHLAPTPEFSCLQPTPNLPNIDNSIAHHSAIQQEVGGGYQPKEPVILHWLGSRALARVARGLTPDRKNAAEETGLHQQPSFIKPGKNNLSCTTPCLIPVFLASLTRPPKASAKCGLTGFSQ